MLLVGFLAVGRSDMVVSCVVLIKKSQVPIESTRLDDEMTMYLKSQQRFLTFSFFNNCIILAQVPVVPARARLGVTTRSMRSQQEFP